MVSAEVASVMRVTGDAVARVCSQLHVPRNVDRRLALAGKQKRATHRVDVVVVPAASPHIAVPSSWRFPRGPDPPTLPALSPWDPAFGESAASVRIVTCDVNAAK